MVLTTCWNLRVSAEANQGGRRYMEDVTAVQFERKNSLEFASFAIFDGHGGREASHFAKDFLMKFIKREKGFFSSRCDVVKKAIRQGFLACHHAMWKKLPEWPRTGMGHPCTAGTTAALVIIRGNKLYVAHVGDSAVVMGSIRDEDGTLECVELTEDHKPEAPKEKNRIEEHGGAVLQKSGVNRVVWERPKISHQGAVRRSTELDRIPFLAVARSLGDLWSWNARTQSFVVSPDPDVEVHDLNKSGSRFIVLASDGVTNMIKPHELIKLVGSFEERKERGEVCGTPAHELVRVALRRWAARNQRADNSSAIVVYIEKKRMEPKHSGPSSYTENWTSVQRKLGDKEPELVKSEAKPEVKPDHEVNRKPLKEMPDFMMRKSASALPRNRKRTSKENNNIPHAVKRSRSTPTSSTGRPVIAQAKVNRRRSTRIAVKKCEFGLTRSAARKRASL